MQPLAKIDSTIDPKLCRAATIAQERANAHSHSLCWRFVKEALVAAGVVRSRPTTLLAKQAGQELVNNYGFKKLPVSNPYEAPLGAVLVYGATRAAAGHVEIRTQDGFVSDQPHGYGVARGLEFFLRSPAARAADLNSKS